MAIGFVLINVAPAHEHEVYNKLSKIPQIVELHPLFGEYDLIAKIDANDFEELFAAHDRHFQIKKNDVHRIFCPVPGRKEIEGDLTVFSADHVESSCSQKALRGLPETLFIIY